MSAPFVNISSPDPTVKQEFTAELQAAARAQIERLRTSDFYSAWPTAQQRNFGHLSPAAFIEANAAEIRAESDATIAQLRGALVKIVTLNENDQPYDIRTVADEALAATAPKEGT